GPIPPLVGPGRSARALAPAGRPERAEATVALHGVAARVADRILAARGALARDGRRDRVAEGEVARPVGERHAVDLALVEVVVDRHAVHRARRHVRREVVERAIDAREALAVAAGPGGGIAAH